MEQDSGSTVKLYPRAKREEGNSSTPLPGLLQTPSGLALLELQGSINTPAELSDGESSKSFAIGKLDFPDYDPNIESSDWMKTVHMYIGDHQRLTGEVKKLPKAFAVVRKRENQMQEGSFGKYMEKGENLEVVEVVKYKLMFSTRPEPVGAQQVSQ